MKITKIWGSDASRFMNTYMSQRGWCFPAPRAEKTLLVYTVYLFIKMFICVCDYILYYIINC